MAEELEGELFQVGEVEGGLLSAGAGEGLGEVAGELEEGDHVGPDPIPILLEGVGVGGLGEEGGPEGGFVEEAFDRGSEFGFGAAGPVRALVGLEDVLDGEGGVRSGGEGVELGEALGGEGGDAAFWGLGVEDWQPGGDPVGQARGEDVEPGVGVWGVEGVGLGFEPGVRVAEGAGVGVEAEDEFPDGEVPTVAAFLDEVADAVAEGGMGVEVLGEDAMEGVVGEEVGLVLVEDAGLGVEVEVEAVLADEVEAEAMEGLDAGGIEEGELFAEVEVVGGEGGFGFEALADAAAHFGGGGLGEGDHEEAVEGAWLGGVAEPGEAAVDEGAGLAGAGAGHDEDVALGEDGAGLVGGRLGHGGAGGAGGGGWG